MASLLVHGPTHAEVSSENGVGTCRSPQPCQSSDTNASISTEPILSRLRNKLFFWRYLSTSNDRNAGSQQIHETEGSSSRVQALDESSHLTESQQPFSPQNGQLSKPSFSQTHAVPDHGDGLESPNAPEQALSANLNTASPISSVPVKSSDIYFVEDHLYVGKLMRLAPPATAETLWLTAKRRRLITDLRPVLASLPQSLARDETTVELELCMMGQRLAKSTTVNLKPTIWVKCGSKACRKAVNEALKDLSYLQPFTFHVSLDAPRFASQSTSMSSSVLLRANTLANTGQPPDTTLGAIIEIIVSFIIGYLVSTVVKWISPTGERQRASAIERTQHIQFEKMEPLANTNVAGNFSINNAESTTINETATRERPLNGTPPFSHPHHDRALNRPPIVSNPFGKSRMSNLMSSCGVRISLDTERNGNARFTCTIGGLIKVENSVYGLTTAHGIWGNSSIDRNQDERCENCDAMGKDISVIDDSGRRLPWKTLSVRKYAYPELCHPGRSHPACQTAEIEGADFALLELSDSTTTRNVFKSLNSTRTIREVALDAESGPVSIVCSDTDVRSGEILSGGALFMDRAGIWETKKVFCDPPLDIGSSGTWVVQHDKLVGIVLATYEKSPYIHILPISKVFDDIRSVVAGGGDPSKISVSLP